MRDSPGSGIGAGVTVDTRPACTGVNTGTGGRQGAVFMMLRVKIASHLSVYPAGSSRVGIIILGEKD